MRLLILTNNVECLGENDAVLSSAFHRLGCESVPMRLRQMTIVFY